MALQGANSADERQDTAHIWHVHKVPNTAVRLVSHKSTPDEEVASDASLPRPHKWRTGSKEPRAIDKQRLFKNTYIYDNHQKKHIRAPIRYRNTNIDINIDM